VLRQGSEAALLARYSKHAKHAKPEHFPTGIPPASGPSPRREVIQLGGSGSKPGTGGCTSGNNMGGSDTEKLGGSPQHPLSRSADTWTRPKTKGKCIPSPQISDKEVAEGSRENLTTTNSISSSHTAVSGEDSDTHVFAAAVSLADKTASARPQIKPGPPRVARYERGQVRPAPLSARNLTKTLDQSRRFGGGIRDISNNSVTADKQSDRGAFTSRDAPAIPPLQVHGYVTS
jgi:hypothetical protein